MPRNRMVKADFWVSEQLVSCSQSARLLFIGLWCFCDDAGVHPASYMRLKMEIFPGDNCTIDDMRHWFAELINSGLVREYAVSDELYWIVLKWKDYQKIDKPTYRYPLPETEFKQINHSTTASGELVDCSSKPNRTVDERLPTLPLLLDTNERKEKEKKGNNICEVETSPCFAPEGALFADIQEVFNYWKNVMSHSRAKFDDKRQRKIVQALKSYSITELKQAIDGCAMTPYNMGNNDRAQKYDDIELILRDASHIERFISHATNPPSAIVKSKNTTTDIMSGVCNA